MSANDKQVGGEHYNRRIQHWDYVVANDMPYLDAQAFRYIDRHRRKNGRQDLEKAIHFIEKMIEVYYPEGDGATTTHFKEGGILPPLASGLPREGPWPHPEDAATADELLPPRPHHSVHRETQWVCGHCGLGNDDHRRECVKCGYTRHAKRFNPMPDESCVNVRERVQEIVGQPHRPEGEREQFIPVCSSSPNGIHNWSHGAPKMGPDSRLHDVLVCENCGQERVQ